MDCLSIHPDLGVLDKFADEELDRKSGVRRGAELNPALGFAGAQAPTPDHFAFHSHFPVATQELQAHRRPRRNRRAGNELDPRVTNVLRLSLERARTVQELEPHRHSDGQPDMAPYR